MDERFPYDQAYGQDYLDGDMMPLDSKAKGDWYGRPICWDPDWCCYKRMRPRKMRRGDAYVFDLQVFAPPPFPSPPGVIGPPQNITGWALTFTAKNNYADPDQAAVFNSNTANALITLTQPTSGLAQVTLPAANTITFPDAPYKLLYDIQGINTLAQPVTVESGILIVYPDITRSLVHP
jgi:hypothetical protein